jgi:hypothetical protein
MSYKFIYKVLIASLGLLYFSTQLNADFYVIPVVKKVKNLITVAQHGADFRDPVAAVASITDASETNRYTIIIGEGIYHLQNRWDLKPYVDIYGVGVSKTVLEDHTQYNANFSSLENSVIHGANHSSINALSITSKTVDVDNYAPFIYNHNTTDFSINDVNISMGKHPYGIYSSSALSFNLNNINISSTRGNSCIYSSDSKMTITNSHISSSYSATDKNVFTVSIKDGSEVSISYSNISALGGGSSTDALFSNASNVAISFSTLTSSAYAINIGGTSYVSIQKSILTGATDSTFNCAGEAYAFIIDSTVDDAKDLERRSNAHCYLTQLSSGTTLNSDCSTP